MKKSILNLISSTCLTLLSISCGAQDRITASNNIITRTISISDYDCIEVSGWPCVVYTQSSDQAPSLRIEAPDNVIDLFECEVKNGKLTIKPKNKVNINFGNRKRPIIYTSSAEIKQMSLSGSGDIIVKSNLLSEQLNIALNGSGDIKGIDISSTNKLSISMNGSGDIAFNRIKANEVSLSLNGSGDLQVGTVSANNVSAQVNGSGDLRVSCSTSNYLSTQLNGSGTLSVKGVNAKEVSGRLQGSGDLTFAGSTKIATLSVKSSGDLSAKALEAQSVQATISGSGDLSCWANNSLITNIKGSGDVTYRGKPAEVINETKKKARKL